MVNNKKRKVRVMGKGPKWSDSAVEALLMVVRVRVEAIDEMNDERLDKECGKHLETVGLVGKSRELKVSALRDWVWSHSKGTWSTAVDPNVKEVKGEVDVEKEVERIVKLLTDNTSATDGGIRSMLFRGQEKVFELAMEHAFRTGKIKRVKTTGGTEVITLA